VVGAPLAELLSVKMSSLLLALIAIILMEEMHLEEIPLLLQMDGSLTCGKQTFQS
jgi:hypothetical protein